MILTSTSEPSPARPRAPHARPLCNGEATSTTQNRPELDRFAVPPGTRSASRSRSRTPARRPSRAIDEAVDQLDLALLFASYSAWLQGPSARF